MGASQDSGGSDRLIKMLWGSRNVRQAGLLYPHVEARHPTPSTPPGFIQTPRLPPGAGFFFEERGTEIGRSYISAMGKKVRARWRISRMRGSKAKLLGVVLAPDQESAIEEAIEYYKITDRKSCGGWWQGRRTAHGDCPRSHAQDHRD
jgi:hypothetical protein